MDYSGPKATHQMSPLISRPPTCLRSEVDKARGGCDLQRPFQRNRLLLGESKAGVAQGDSATTAGEARGQTRQAGSPGQAAVTTSALRKHDYYLLADCW